MQYCFSESRGRIGRARVVSHLIQVVCQADQSTQYLAMWSSYKLKILYIYNKHIYIKQENVSLQSCTQNYLKIICQDQQMKTKHDLHCGTWHHVACKRHQHFRGLLPPSSGYAGGGTLLQNTPTNPTNHMVPHPRPEDRNLNAHCYMNLKSQF